MRPAAVARAFSELHAAGTMGYFGVSNHRPAQISLLRTADAQPLPVDQLQLSLDHHLIGAGIALNRPTARYAYAAALDYFRQHDILVEAGLPLAGGHLFRPDPPGAYALLDARLCPDRSSFMSSGGSGEIPASLLTKMSKEKRVHYTAAGAVVIHDERVLVLKRPSREEVRLPKGHIDAGEKPLETALRETSEESGYRRLEFLADLGQQTVSFDLDGQHVTRDEYYFLLRLTATVREPLGAAEAQFEPAWLSWDEALSLLTFAAEREWVRRARRYLARHDSDAPGRAHPAP
jgi:8-oxo-dGTP pyrophosphatase MutT (NUDIX family)